MFADKGVIYYENGLNVMPVGNGYSHVDAKKAFFKGFSIYKDTKIPEDLFNKWTKDYPQNGIGLLLGEYSNVIAFDFDYKGEGKKELEAVVRNLLPPCSFSKFGGKGFTAFYKYEKSLSSKITLKRSINDKKKSGVVEILTNGQYTVMPPSRHDIDKMFYKWQIGNCEDFKANDLEVLTLDHVNKIKFEIYKWFNKRGIINELEDEEGRNNDIFNYACKLFNSFPDEDIIKFSEQVYDYDLETNGSNSWFNDKKESSKGLGLEAAIKFCKITIKNIQDRQQRENRPVKQLGKVINNKQKEGDYETYKAFFEMQFKEVKKCYLTGSVLTKDSSYTMPVDNLIKQTRAFSTDYGLKKHMVEDYLYRWMDELPREYIFNLPEHDGIDYIDKYISYMKFKYIDHKYAVELFKEWLSKVFLRLENNQIQNTMIILNGFQGIGKDSYIFHMLKGLDSYYQNIPIENRLVENYQKMYRAAVFNISEFDTIENVIDYVQLKQMITASSYFFRLPYERTPKQYNIHTSWISSCNPSIGLFKDSTGNRRFWFMEVESIDWDYPKDMSGLILSQAYALAKEGYAASKEAKDVIEKIVSKMTPENFEEVIVKQWDEMLIDVYARDLNARANKFIRGPDATRIIKDISTSFNTGVRKVREVLRYYGCHLGDDMRGVKWKTSKIYGGLMEENLQNSINSKTEVFEINRGKII